MKERLRIWLVNRALRFLRPDGYVQVFHVEERAGRAAKAPRVVLIDETQINPFTMRVIEAPGWDVPVVGSACERLIVFGDPDAPEPQREISAP